MKTSAMSESTRQRESMPVLESTPTLELFRVEESTLLESTPHPYLRSDRMAECIVDRPGDKIIDCRMGRQRYSGKNGQHEKK